MNNFDNIKPMNDDASHADVSLETKAMLELIEQGKREIAEGKVMSVERAFEKVRSSMAKRSM